MTSKTFYLDGTHDPVIHYAYDAYGNIQTQTDPNGNITQTTYDVTNTFPQTITNPKGQTGTIDYNYAYGKPSDKIDANGNKTSYFYDAFGRLLTVTGPTEQNTAYVTTTYTYMGKMSPLFLLYWTLGRDKFSIHIQLSRKGGSENEPGRDVHDVCLLPGTHHDRRSKRQP